MRNRRCARQQNDRRYTGQKRSQCCVLLGRSRFHFFDQPCAAIAVRLQCRPSAPLLRVLYRDGNGGWSYNSPVQSNTLSELLIGAAFLCCAAVVPAVMGYRLSSSIRKRRLEFLAYVLLGSGICIGASAIAFFQWSLPVIQADGIIEGAQVHVEGRGHRTNLQIRLQTGELVDLNASGRSEYFRFGEHVIVKYKAVTGSIVKAQFLSSSGTQEAVFNGTDSWPPYIMFSFGMFAILVGFKKNRRASEPYK